MNILLRRRKLGHGSCKGIQEASTTGLSVLRNDAPFPTDIEYVFRWGCTSNIPEGAKAVNSAKSIHWCSDKRQGRLDMQEANVSVPKTISVLTTAPVQVFLNANNIPTWVGRPAHHAQGRNLITGRLDECVRQVRAWGGGYVSELINKVAEYRVAVIQNRVAWVAQKTPGNPDQVAWNVAQGGKFENVRWDNWPMQVVKEAIAAAKVSGTDFCGVDVMVDAAGKAFVLEVNSAPSQTSPYRQKCFAKCFDYIITNGKDHFPEPTHYRNYKKVIHPALIVEE
jgi:hypothetical protein